MTRPQHGGCAIATQPELSTPSCQSQTALPLSGDSQAIPVKGQMPRFVAQYQRAHRAERRVITMPVQDTIIRTAHQFREREDLKFESNAEQTSHLTEGGEAPMGFDSVSAETVHGASQQTGVLRLLGEPECHQPLHFFAAARQTMRIESDQFAFTPAIAELKLLEGREKRRQLLRRHNGWRVPIGLDAVPTIACEMFDPSGAVQRRAAAASVSAGPTEYTDNRSGEQNQCASKHWPVEPLRKHGP